MTAIPRRLDEQLKRDAAAMRVRYPLLPDPEALPLALSADIAALTDAQKFKLWHDLIEGVYALRSDDLSDALLPVREAFHAVYDECRSIVDYEAGERMP
jgi:hypothetical protein